MEFVRIRDVGKATIADNKKQKHDIENYLKQVYSGLNFSKTTIHIFWSNIIIIPF